MDIRGKIFLVPRLPSAPASPSEGQIYYNTVDKKCWQHNGTTWISFDTGSAAALAAHEADTTNVHGIANTSYIAYTNAANTFTPRQRLSDGAYIGTGNKVLYDDSYSMRAYLSKFTADYDVEARTGGDAARTQIGAVGPALESGILFGLAGDTNLYRVAGPALTTDNQFLVIRGAVGNTGYSLRVSGDVNNRWYMSAAGTMMWGDGTLSPDTNLYRSAADTLKTDDALIVGGALTAMAGLAMNSQKVTGLAAGTATTDAVNKSQMDAGNAFAAHMKMGFS